MYQPVGIGHNISERNRTVQEPGCMNLLPNAFSAGSENEKALHNLIRLYPLSSLFSSVFRAENGIRILDRPPGTAARRKLYARRWYTRRNTLCLRWAGPGRRQDNRRRQVRHIAVIQPAGLANRTGEPIRRAAALLGPIELLPTGNERHNALLYGKCLRMDLATRRPGRKHLRIRL